MQTRKSNSSKILKRIGLFKASDAIEAGVSQPKLSRLTAAGEVVRIEHGFYRHKDTDLDPVEIEFTIACRRAGAGSVIGGLSALFYYGLISQVPGAVWMMIPATNTAKFPQYRVLRTKHDPTVGVKEHQSWRIVTVERAIVEAFCYATKMGLQTALGAARTALREKKVTLKSIQETATKLKLWHVVAKHWEGITTP
jgi:predicted transcriptional regulator of viral defense system